MRINPKNFFKRELDILPPHFVNTVVKGQDSEMYNNPRNKNSDTSDFRPSLIGDDSRVYKGGSWLDRSYYLDPAQRRFLPEYITSNSIGFRCAMSYLGEDRNITKPKKR